MFEYMIGKVTAIWPSYLVLEVNGIGYHLVMANPFRLTDTLQSEVQLHVYQHVTQDNVSLFGFRHHAEKKLFLKLISVSGIGPKSALAILASDDHDGLVSAIEAEHISYLQKFPGVGKKTAAQMVLDLKGKLSDVVTTTKAGASENRQVTNANKALDEALEALASLGYSKREVEKVKKVLDALPVSTTDVYIREALKQLLQS